MAKRLSMARMRALETQSSADTEDEEEAAVVLIVF
jgi:hypothetical protein